MWTQCFLCGRNWICTLFRLCLSVLSPSPFIISFMCSAQTFSYTCIQQSVGLEYVFRNTSFSLPWKSLSAKFGTTRVPSESEHRTDESAVPVSITVRHVKIHFPGFLEPCVTNFAENVAPPPRLVYFDHRNRQDFVLLTDGTATERMRQL
jgi:hypothetical protein